MGGWLPVEVSDSSIPKMRKKLDMWPFGFGGWMKLQILRYLICFFCIQVCAAADALKSYRHPQYFALSIVTVGRFCALMFGKTFRSWGTRISGHAYSLSLFQYLLSTTTMSSSQAFPSLELAIHKHRYFKYSVSQTFFSMCFVVVSGLLFGLRTLYLRKSLRLRLLRRTLPFQSSRLRFLGLEIKFGWVFFFLRVQRVHFWLLFV